MAGFDDVIERGFQQPSVDETNKIPKSKPKAENNTSILELVEGLNLGGISNNLNPDMKEKVLVPLANLLDKYGLSESIGESTTAQAGMGLFSLLGDIAPVIKGLADYVSGQKNRLSAEDSAFLDKIKESQSNGEFSDLFNSDNVVEEEVQQKAPQQNHVLGPNGEPMSSMNMNLKEVDWWSVMGVENPEQKLIRQMPKSAQTYMAKNAGQKLPQFGSAGEKPSIKGLPTLDELAAQIGKSVDDLDNPTNSESQSENKNEIIGVDLGSIDFNNEEADELLANIDLDEIYNIDFESED